MVTKILEPEVINKEKGKFIFQAVCTTRKEAENLVKAYATQKEPIFDTIAIKKVKNSDGKISYELKAYTGKGNIHGTIRVIKLDDPRAPSMVVKRTDPNIFKKIEDGLNLNNHVENYPTGRERQTLGTFSSKAALKRFLLGDNFKKLFGGKNNPGIIISKKDGEYTVISSNDSNLNNTITFADANAPPSKIVTRPITNPITGRVDIDTLSVKLDESLKG